MWIKTPALRTVATPAQAMMTVRPWAVRGGVKTDLAVTEGQQLASTTSSATWTQTMKRIAATEDGNAIREATCGDRSLPNWDEATGTRTMTRARFTIRSGYVARGDGVECVYYAPNDVVLPPDGR